MTETATGEITYSAFQGWAMVEQMGFRKTVGKVSEVEMYGAKLLRLDVPVMGPDGKTVTEFVTRFCGGPSIYQITPLDEELAIDAAARQADPRPVRPVQYRIGKQAEMEELPEYDDHDEYDRNP